MKSILAIALGLLFAASSASAAFPDKPVTLIVPFPAGGATDAMARFTANRLSKELGQPVVVDNRGGAGGVIAAETALGAPKDGYTIFFATTGTMAINPFIYRKLKYNPLTDFEPVGNVASASNVLVVHPSVKAKNVAELIALAQARPGKLTYASAGIGTSSHLSGALFESMTSTQMLHVPYKGSAPALSDFLAGRVDMMFDTASTHAPYVKAGKIRALAVTSPRKSPAFPGVPSIAEAGVPGYDVTIWFGVAAPAGVPKASLDRLSAALQKAWQAPDIKAALADVGADPLYLGPAEYERFIAAENQKWGRVVKASGAEAQD
ncbi:tripartite tricarboxylate transporter substrate binding protein [Variovorax sp. J22P271]|uniref:Bug family tripartite tricarboxylate transporter substrate binding protein n=1 Tax=Variovorax davisae TaxID=3053515 RepID=UPI002574F35B|nr:tripartite tricarboxylate transporter substrate binding protein [Variovorax sp. J22P271]MDM0032019.1 tripartite tricarboxylate transporter substrate binding protein [Variovorax sp. J22P271]